MLESLLFVFSGLIIGILANVIISHTKNENEDFHDLEYKVKSKISKQIQVKKAA